MRVGMTMTGRHTSRKLSTPGKRAMATQDGEQIARGARIEELRRLIAAGRYKVEPKKLAARILDRALRKV